MCFCTFIAVTLQNQRFPVGYDTSNPTDVDTVRGNGEVMCCVPILSRSVYVPLDIKV